jgi:hypothetical protein
LKLNLPDCFTAVVGDMYINVETGAADPDLSMQTCSDADNFNSSIARLNPFVRRGQRAWKRHESLLSYLRVSLIVSWKWEKNTYGHIREELKCFQRF